MDEPDITLPPFDLPPGPELDFQLHNGTTVKFPGLGAIVTTAQAIHDYARAAVLLDRQARTPPEATATPQPEDLTYRQLYEDACILANNNALEAIRNAKDALRYRLLRDFPATYLPEGDLRVWMANRPFDMNGPRGLDALCDAAIAAGGEE